MQAMSQGPTAFAADVAWRLEAPPPRRDRARLFTAIVAAILIELGVVALIWVGRGLQPAPPVAEIPVEIIVEKPPPPPPPPAPQAKTQEYLKPATDAPREGKSDHDDEHVADKPTPAKAPPPPETPPQPKPAQAAPAPAPELPKTAEAEAPPPQKAEPVETPVPAAQKPQPVATPAPAKPTVADVLPKIFDSVPEVDFGGAAMRSLVSGGTAKANYLSELYGLIVPRLRVPAIAHTYGRALVGKIGFAVDGRGRLTQRYIVEQSGSMELDEAALRAVAAAAHGFPPPPHKQPMGMTFTYSVR